MSPQYTDLQLDALRELANIGSGTASTALSGMLGRSVDIAVPNAQALPFAEAVDAVGPAEQDMTGIVLGIVGEMSGTVLLLVPPADADALCRMLGVELHFGVLGAHGVLSQAVTRFGDVSSASQSTIRAI